MSEIRIWNTSTDLAASEMERKKYYVILEDEGKPDLKMIIVRGPGLLLTVEPYVEHEYDYDHFDDEEEEDEEEYSIEADEEEEDER